jgi:hypothetical protein
MMSTGPKRPLFEKSGAKTFAPLEPAALKLARPKKAKFFCYFLFTESSLFLYLPAQVPSL